MPYKLNGLCVIKADTGETVKCHQNKAEALAHLRALEANVPDAKAFQGLLSQQETSYVPLSATPGQACANCRWFFPNGRMDSNEAMCHLVSSYPEPILATGYCDRWEVVPPPPSLTQTPTPVVIVEPPMDMDDSQEMALPTTRRGLIDIIRDTVKALAQPPPDEAFSVFKSNGKKYWLARHTGKWVDREGEIITNKAHEEYVARVQKGLVPLPELWVWHKQGTRHGQADMVWKAGGFILALGHFDATPEGEKAYAYYSKNSSKIKLSHMFHYPKRAKQNGVYHAYNTVEITTLPAGAEAFPYTSFEELKTMALTPEQKVMITDILGTDGLKRVESADSKAHADSKTLDDNGVVSKGLNNFEGSDIPADKALETLKSDMDTRLKAIEALPARMEALQTVVKTLSAEVQEAQKSEANALKELNALKLQLLEYQTLAPPSSKAKDTILSEREKQLLQSAEKQGQVTTSLIGMMAGETAPVVSSQ